MITPSCRLLARRALLSTAVATGLWAAVPAVSYAFDYASPAPVNLSQGDVAIQGHDPVAYFTQNAAVPGSPEFTAAHAGATYRFASAANREAFEADPARYVPAYGGFCAFGLVYGQKVDIDPLAFSIVDDTLYLNVNKSVQQRWSKDVPGNVSEADANWPRIRDVAPNDL